MKAQMALSGKQEPSSRSDLQHFTKGFIAGLVARDLLAVRPQDPAERKGFAEVVRFLDGKIDDLEKIGADKRWILNRKRTASNHNGRV
jgi:hypothetical protein